MKNSAELQITNNETQVNNKLIAEFMGYEFITNNIFIHRLPKDFLLHSENYKCFHNDWNWLMKVVQKIERLGHRITITTQVDDWCNVLFHNPKFIHVEREKDKKLTVYLACISFIKWHNENK